MIYLDYSATTPVNRDVLDTFLKIESNYIGNANSLHKLGIDNRKIIDKSESVVSDVLNLKEKEIIFTSSASEANNFCIKSSVFKYQNRGKHIITTKLEHSSVLETVNFLENNGYEVSYVNIDSNGLVDIDDLKSKIRKDTVLVSICQVNSEVGFLQDINMISDVIKSINPLTIFHVDGTQAIGKTNVDLNNIDLYTFSAHKFYGLKGIACVIKRKNLVLEPLIHGGKSQSIYRSGTPTTALIASLAKALKIAYQDFNEKLEHVKKLNNLLKEELLKIDNVIINSNDNCISNILNISVLGIKPETLLHALEEYDIYISTKTACSKDNSDSLSLTTIGKSSDISGHSVRISISYLTTEEEINIFVEKLKECIEKLIF